MREHPSDVYVPLGLCSVCSKEVFLDGTPDDLRVRPHWIQDQEMRARMTKQAAANGRRVYEFPNCLGSNKPPKADSVSFPLVMFERS